jgi:hypothetical protein
MKLKEVLKTDYNYIVNLIEDEISDKRKKAAVL